MMPSSPAALRALIAHCQLQHNNALKQAQEALLKERRASQLLAMVLKTTNTPR